MKRALHLAKTAEAIRDEYVAGESRWLGARMGSALFSERLPVWASFLHSSVTPVVAQVNRLPSARSITIITPTDSSNTTTTIYYM